MRLKEFSETIPKPMINIGYRPIIWHLMKYYAHQGHTEFILCLGYRGDIIKEYFLQYNECLSNDFVLSDGGRSLQLLNSDISNWTISFVETGLYASIGERLKKVEPLLKGDEMFMANYSDGLTDLKLDPYISQFENSNSIASFLCVPPAMSFHVVSIGDRNEVKKIIPAGMSGLWMNAGFFLFRRQIFDYLKPGEELINEPFQRLIEIERLTAYRYTGFFGCMDTFKEKQMFDDMYSRGEAPWEAWKSEQPEM